MEESTKKCLYCDFLFLKFEELLEHLNQKHFRCAECFKVFDKIDDLLLCQNCREKHWN